MASGCDPGRAGCQIKIRCLKPELLSSLEDFEEMTDSQVLERTLVTQNIDVTSPLSSISGEGTAYFYDQMQVETCATPMGLGMEDGDIVALWNPSKLPRSWEGKKKKRNREKLKERIIQMTAFTDRESVLSLSRTESLSRGLNPVMLMGEDGVYKCPQELVSHGPTCTSKQEVETLLKRIAGSKSKQTEAELANQKKLEGVEWEIGFSLTPEVQVQADYKDRSHSTIMLWYQKMWVKDSRNENKNLSEFIERVTFTLHFKIDGVPFPTSFAVTSWPYRFQELSRKPEIQIPSKITVEILFHEPFAALLPGHDGLITLDHAFAGDDVDGAMNMKWNKILEIGNNLKEGKFKNICEVIAGLPVFRQSILADCSLDQVNMSADAMSKDMESKDIEDTLKYCAGFNEWCITDLLWSHPSTCQFIADECLNSFMYIGPVRNGASLDQSPMPIVSLAPYMVKGTVDNLVEIWKYYVTKEGFRLPEGPFCVTYNGKKVDVGNDTSVLDIIDRSMSKHYFAIPLPGSDYRDINRLLEFIEGPETSGGGRKKKKNRKKASVKETPEEVADKGNGEVAGCLENTRIDGSGLNSHLLRNTPMKSKKCNRTDKSGERQLSEPDRRDPENKVSVTEQGFNICNEVDQDEHASSLHGLDSIRDHNIQALKEELISKEAKLGELWDSSRVLVESRGTEMCALVLAVEDAEEEKNLMLKQVAKLEDQMQSIRDQLVKIQERKDQLIKDVEEKDEQLNESLKKKYQLEDLIEAEVDENKQSKRQLEKEMGSLQARIDASTKDGANMSSDTVDKAKLETQRFLLNINKKIEAKESDLECPVCLEVSTVPIFSCDEQHIIYSACRPKVSICSSQSIRSFALFTPCFFFRSQSAQSAGSLTQISREGTDMQRKQLRSSMP